MTIFYKANVFQNSGVEWKDVKLSFSNATPWVAGDIPVLYPWFIDYYNPATSYAKRRRLQEMMRNDPAAMSESSSRFRR